MKGLESIPSLEERTQIADVLESKPLEIEILIHCFGWSRLDPRFGEILVAAIARDWKILDPFLLNLRVRSHPWAAVLGVLCEHAELLVSRIERPVFRIWKRSVLLDIRPASGEVFWVGLYPFGGRGMRRIVDSSLKPFLRWGFYGHDLMINKAKSHLTVRTLVSKRQRLEILDAISKVKPFFTIRDYLDALGNRVHKRVAELDLKQSSGIRSYGERRARIYRRKRI